MKSKYFNRELSWVEFNYRVLYEATRSEVPLLERFKFLAITESNFDEFFQVRIAALRHQKDPEQIEKKISERVHEIRQIQYNTLYNEILPQLKHEGISYIKGSQLSQEQKSYTENIFKHEIFPLLTPLRTDGSKIAHIGTLKLTAAFILQQYTKMHYKETLLSPKTDSELLAFVEIPSSIDRIVWLPSSENQKEFTTVDDIITLYASELFPGYKITESALFKIARDADVSVDENAGKDFIKAMEEVLQKRQSSFAVCMTCTSGSKKIITLLKEMLNLTDDETYLVPGLVDLPSLMNLTNVAGMEHLLYPVWKNFYPEEFPKENTYWNSLRQQDIILNVPYQSYDPVVKFITDAANDKNVLAIKMTLYRTGSNSPIVEALKVAAQNGKQVTAFVELKARFDEKRNISWANELEKEGVIVVYGIVDLKVHAKICLVVRKESDGIRRYAHLSTGNYNPNTAKTYSDLSLFTSKPEIVSDATLFFNIISGYSAVQTMHHIYIAPVTLKTKLLELIEREIKLSTPNKPGLIMAKMNSLCHPEIIDALYRASCSGVKILLNVRGICTLVPGVRDLSENIKVVSIIDRYLEHSRIFYFQNAGQEELYLSSADWMERNLDRRIELMFPITDTNIFKKTLQILNLYFEDNTHSHILNKDGKWKPLHPEKNEQSCRAQEVLYKKYKKKSESLKAPATEQFIVRRNS